MNKHIKWTQFFINFAAKTGTLFRRELKFMDIELINSAEFSKDFYYVSSHKV